jgi:hypothetical protein
MTTIEKSSLPCPPAAASAKAASQSALDWPGVAPLMAARRAALSSVSGLSTRGDSPTEMTVMLSSAANSLTTRSAAACAASKRVPPGASMACMLADASSNNATLPDATDGTSIKGRASATTSIAKMSNCNSKSRLRRKRCQGELASRSRSSCRQRSTLLTGTSRRRSLSI